MKSLFGNWLLAVLLFAGVCWYFWQKDQAQIAGLAARYGAPPAPAAAPTSP